MNRTHLERAAEALAVKRGYAFHADPDGRLPLCVASFPAAVLAPPELLGIQGRRHGRATYALTLRLLCAGAKLPPAERNTALAELEEALLSVFSELSDDPKVIAVEQLAIRPGAFGLTPRGELSQTATANVITCF